jgi:hypothetical protein
VETPGNEEYLSCLHKLPTSHEVIESDTIVSEATQDNFERHLQESFLEMRNRPCLLQLTVMIQPC